MHRVFQKFIDHLSAAESEADFSELMANTAAALDLSCFAYLALPSAGSGKPGLISTYPTQWTSHYLRNNYERIDPVIREAIKAREPFRWGVDLPFQHSSQTQRRLFDEASQFGIRFGFTVPLHDGRGPIAALTFASDERRRSFETCIDTHARVLQLMAMYFHSHARRKLNPSRVVEGVALTPREFECLEWAAQGKSSWEIGCILGISRHTVTSYLESAKKKLGVRTIVQAATRLAAAKREEHN
jgi:LuxR family transcriptional activator of conjugal transfer of Ti plasmids